MSTYKIELVSPDNNGDTTQEAATKRTLPMVKSNIKSPIN